jgi:hypothetical protein
VSTEETPERPRQRRRQWTVVSVAMAVLLAGGGAAYWASNATGGDASPAAGESDPPPLALDGLGHQESGGGPSRDIAPGEPDPGSPAYTAKGELPEGPAAARVYRPDDKVSRSDVSALAEALDIAGEPERQGSNWRVAASGDGSGPALTVGDGKTAGTWSFSRYVPSGDDKCAQPPKGSDAMPMPCPHKPGSVPGSDGGDPVSEKEAKEAVRPALEALGLKGAEMESTSTNGALRVISAHMKVGGMVTHDWTSTFTVGGDGELVRGQGRAGELRQGAEYPVMTAAQTLEQLNDNRGGAVGDVVCDDTPEPDGVQSSDERVAHDSECASPSRPKAAEVTDAVFGLTTRYAQGESLLVPSWIFEVRQPGGSEPYKVTYPAVEAEYVTQSDEGQDRDGGAGDAPGAASVTSYSADGSTLNVTFWAGVCHTYKADAEEEHGKVTVSVEAEKARGENCIKIAKKQTIEVELDKALGDREVLDARDGEPLKKTG